MLAKSISGTMNAAALGIPCLIAGVLVWVVAGQRLQRRAPAAAGDDE